MVRKGRQSLNSSAITNVSIIEDEFSHMVERLSITNSDSKLIGYNETIAAINEEIEALINGSGEPEFTLLTGPTGTGKTSFIRKLASRPDIKFFFLDSSWTLQKRFGNPESYIQKIFEDAASQEIAPSIIFIDEIHWICSEKRSDIKDRVFLVLLNELKCLKARSARVLVFAATDKPELDPEIRKEHYFSREIEFSLPKKQDRIEILIHLTAARLTNKELEQLAELSHCYSFKDFKNICKIASKEDQDLNYITLKKAMSQYKPAAVKSITTPCPPLRWEDIGGVAAAKDGLQSIMQPLELRDKFQKLGYFPDKGALLYGPPGCSKTMLAQALATESGFNFICIKGPELYSKFVGDSEAAVRKLYRSAREIAPTIIFFDEIDGCASTRSDSQSSSVGEKVVTQLLTELDGVEPLHNVYTLAATNRPDRIDPGLLRPGRLDSTIYIPLPPKADRVEIFKVHMKPLAVRFDRPLETVIDDLASRTEGYSGAEIAKICRLVGKVAVKENIDAEYVEQKHFEKVLKEVRPKTRADQLKVYEDFEKEQPQLGRTKKRSLLNKLRRLL